MKYRIVVLCISSAAVILSLALLLTKGVNFSVDFAGGVAIQLRFENPTDVGSIRETLSESGLSQATIQAYDDSNILIRYQDTGDENQKEMIQLLGERHGGVEISQIDNVGPIVGRELRKQAFIAVSLSIAGILLYMAFRFSFRFGVAAVIALVHDSVIMLGVYSLTGREISTSFIAAILTVIGYSLNDSIVVLDRIRENWNQIRSKGIIDLVDSSINQTLSRTINTSLTTLLPVFAMFFLGGEVISNLAFAFLIGIVVGTYSSIYIASSILVEWYLRKPVKN
jgi:preprotein translocase subunit SecF